MKPSLIQTDKFFFSFRSTSLEEDGRQYGHGARRDHQDEQGCETGGDKCEIIGKVGDEAVEKKSVEFQCFHRGLK